MSRIEINADGRHVVVDGDGNLDDLAKTAMDCGRSTMADAPTVPCGHVLVPSMMAEALTGVDPACPQCGVRMDRFDALYAANERGQDCGNCGHWSDVHADGGGCGECECPTLRRLSRYLICPGSRWAS